MRVLILSADIGDGHATAARALSAQLRAQGASVYVDEQLRALGRMQRFVLRDGSRLLFRRAPRVYGASYQLLLHSRLARWLATRSLVRGGSRTMLRMIAEQRPDVIVSTYPGTTVVLGALRASGRVEQPTVATVLDIAGLFFWAHPGIDLHLAHWQQSIDEILAVAPQSAVRHVAPLTSAAFASDVDALQARRALDLPEDRSVIVVSGGGWGVGDLRGAVQAAASVPASYTVCVAGRNEKARDELAGAFADHADVRVLGFTDRMSDLLAAADVLVHGTGGVTCLEAAARRCPVVLYGFSVGHVRHNTEAMRELGLVHAAASRGQLPLTLQQVLAQPRPVQPGRAVDAGELILNASPRATAKTATARRPTLWQRRRRLASAMLALTATLTFAISAPGKAIVHRVPIAKLEHIVDRDHQVARPPTR